MVKKDNHKYMVIENIVASLYKLFLAHPWFEGPTYSHIRLVSVMGNHIVLSFYNQVW